jgi:hypothetical protein
MLGANATLTMQTAAMHADRTVFVTGALTIGSGATADVGGNDAIIHNGNLAALTTAAHSGLTGGSSRWTGTGLQTSVGTVANDPNGVMAIGLIINNNAGSPIYATFDGQGTGTSDVLMKTTFFGDGDLNGSVNAADYSRIDNGFALGLTGWINGDFNYDGTTNSADYSLIDNSFAFQSAANNPLGTAPLAAALSATASVPEPTAVGILAAGAVTLLRRRRPPCRKR